jgi:hypothetical protein
VFLMTNSLTPGTTTIADTGTALSTTTGPARGSGNHVSFAGTTASRGEPLRSPVSGAPCVHWRLRIVEQVAAALQLVHEIASTEDFDVTWAGTGNGSSPADALRIRVAPQLANIHAVPVLHRPGSPGAIATAGRFGFSGQLSVEEVVLRIGDEIVADGILEDPGALSCGPFRAVDRELELLGATVRLPARVTLGPVLLPWALGTAAALLGGVGAATWAAWHFDLLPQLRSGVSAPAAEIGPDRPTRRHFSVPE